MVYRKLCRELLAVAIGDGVTATVPLLQAMILRRFFARRPNGLFVAHFGWSAKTG